MFEPNMAGSRHKTFEAVALTHFDTMYNVAMACTRNPDEAQDLVQETYYRAYRFWESFQPGTRVQAWLLTILRHTHISAYRKASRQRLHAQVEPVASWDDDVSFTSAWTDPASMEAMLRHLVQDEVKQAIDALPETYRLPVILADLAACSYQEIATILGCPLSTVMSRLFRGRRLLRTRLQAFAEASGYIGARQPYALCGPRQVSESRRPSPRRVASKQSAKPAGAAWKPQAEEGCLMCHHS